MGPRSPASLPGSFGRRNRTKVDEREHRCCCPQAFPVGQLREGPGPTDTVQQLVVERLRARRTGAATRVRQGEIEGLLRRGTGCTPGSLR